MTFDRRRFLKASGTIVAAGLLTNEAFASVLDPANSELTSRTVLPLNQDWLWSAFAPVGSEKPDFSDAAFERITLPHSNVFVPWHGTDQTSFQFVSVYRKHFTLPTDLQGQRVFVDFEGVMTASKVFLNGQHIGEYQGGFTPFSFELTRQVAWNRENVLSVEVDSHELPEVPPFGYEIDYLTYGGIYREVSLRITATTYIENIQVRCIDVLKDQPSVEVDIFLDSAEDIAQAPDSITLEITGPDGAVAHIESKLSSAEIQAGRVPLTLHNLSDIKKWQLLDPVLYSARVRLFRQGRLTDESHCRFGFREAHFTPAGFTLNGEIVKLRGLNRHQTFPFAGPAMPARVQRKDAAILKHELKCNVVRCSHYPQSHHFLDACDELGLLVIDETPGWQHVGDSTEWRERYLDNTRRMIRRDWNHPSVILWSVRINESRDFHDLYVRANAIARGLDTTRQTTGVRYFQESEFLEDVFSMNDFGFPLKAPNHPLYLNTESVGAEYPVRAWDDNAHHQEQILRYARIYNQINGNAGYAGGLGWCAFDYQTHADFGAGDHICYHGVMDIFRIPKPAAGFFRSQCSPAEEVVLEPGFHFAENDQPGGFEHAVICSNCDLLKCFIKQSGDWRPLVDLHPAREDFPHLAYPPFFLSLPNGNDDWGDLRIDGYVQGKMAITRSFSGKGIDQKFSIACDDHALMADGSDATRVVLRVTDEFGAARPLCNDPIQISVEGDATLVGSNPLALAGGVSAVWIRAKRTPGTVTVRAVHPHFGEQSVRIKIVAAHAQTISSAWPTV
jgi:beta-galactosidase